MPQRANLELAAGRGAGAGSGITHGAWRGRCRASCCSVFELFALVVHLRPRQIPISTFARPSLKYIFRGTSVKPFFEGQIGEFLDFPPVHQQFAGPAGARD